MDSTPEQLRFASIPGCTIRADFAGGGLSSDLGPLLLLLISQLASLVQRLIGESARQHQLELQFMATRRSTRPEISVLTLGRRILDAPPRYLHQLVPWQAIPLLTRQAARACAATALYMRENLRVCPRLFLFPPCSLCPLWQMPLYWLFGLTSYKNTIKTKSYWIWYLAPLQLPHAPDTPDSGTPTSA